MPFHKVGPVPHRLGVRLIAAVGIALLPLAVLAYVQAERMQNEAQARREASLFGATLLAATPVVQTISNAQGLVGALAGSLPGVIDDDAACSLMMRRALETDQATSFVAFVATDAITHCNSRGTVIDFTESALTAQLLTERTPGMTINRHGPVSGESILAFTHPVFGAAGNYLGFVSVSVPHRKIDQTSGPNPTGIENRPLSLITFAEDGEILSARFGLDNVDERLPMGVPLVSYVGKGPITFSGVTITGERRVFAVVPMVEGKFYLLSSWSPESAWGLLQADLPLWAFPAAMWLASLAVAWIAAEYQVLRHVRALRGSIIAFAGGNRTVSPPDLHDAPLELRHVGEAYERLMESVLHDEAELEDMVHQREVLLREVHHRVKNNLQLIASIMNIQMRKAASPEAKALIKGLHDRVMSLATVHRELYQTSGQADVRADELLQMIVSQVLRMGAQPGREIVPETDFHPIRLTPDQSVPLSLVLTEALTNVLKHARPDAEERKVHLSVSLREAGDGKACLRIANSAPAADIAPRPGIESTGLGERLLQAFASQLGGQLESGRTADGFELTLTFPLTTLTEAEQRYAET